VVEGNLSATLDDATLSATAEAVDAPPSFISGGGGGGGGSGRSSTRVRSKEIDEAVDRVVARMRGESPQAADPTPQQVVAEVKQELPGVTFAQVRAAMALIAAERARVESELARIEADNEEEEEAAVMLLAA
jgi:hypothetical protein